MKHTKLGKRFAICALAVAMMVPTALAATAADEAKTVTETATTTAAATTAATTDEAAPTVTTTTTTETVEAKEGDKIVLAGISANYVYVSLAPGQSVLVDTEVELPTEAKGKDVKVQWTSSDSKIASVDENGRIRGLFTGKCVVTAAVGSAKVNIDVEVAITPLPFDEVEHSRKRLAFMTLDTLLNGEATEVEETSETTEATTTDETATTTDAAATATTDAAAKTADTTTTTTTDTTKATTKTDAAAK